MPFVELDDARLHVEIDGEGEPVTVLAHGLTNTCRELSRITPLILGTKIRFCFRGHGHSSSPESGYRFADFARDVDAVAAEYGATRAIGTSLGAGAIGHLVAERPDRFERMVFLLPAGLDRPFANTESFMRTAELLESKPPEEAVDAILSDPSRVETYLRHPWMRDFDRETWDHADFPALARCVREVMGDFPIPDRDLMRRVVAPTMILSREGDEIHRAEVGRILADLMPNPELLVFEDDVELFQAMPQIIVRVNELFAP